MEKHLRIKSIKDEDNDLEYWESCSAQERIDALELLRTQFLQLNKRNTDAKSGLQRVCNITQRKEN